MRVETTLLGRPIECSTESAARLRRRSIMLNGEALPFTHRANPHRRGAALVAKPALLTRLTSERNTLTIEIG